MSNSKKQSLIAVGCGLIIFAVALFAYALTQPRVIVEYDVDTSTVSPDDLFIDDESTTVAPSVNQQPSAEQTTQNNNSTTSTSQVILSVTYPLNLNTCTRQELETIKGIGESKADAIIQYREYLGEYTSVEQIKNIRGFGDKLYEKIAPYLTV